MISPKDQKRKFKKVAGGRLQEKKKYYIVGRKWFEKFCAHVGLNPDNPTADQKGVSFASAPDQISNSHLLIPDQKNPILKQGLLEHVNFEILSESAWKLLLKWYSGGPEISRDVITLGARRECRVDLYPLYVKVFVTAPSGEVDEKTPPVEFAASRHTSLRKVVQRIKQRKNQQGRVWMRELPDEMAKELGWDSKPEEKGKEGEKGEEAKVVARRWRLLPDHVHDFKLEAFDFKHQDQPELLVDWRRKDGWSRTGGAQQRPFGQFEVNDEVDAKDKQGTWYEAVIRLVRAGRVHVHFKNWGANYDEWIKLDENRLAPLNKHTTGPHKARQERYGRLERPHSMGAPATQGAVGLRNLGNTCFMNSTLQCLSNTPRLTDYFIDDKYVPEINRTNPMGWHGKIATEWGRLMHEIWGGQYRTVAPRKLKQVIGEFQPRFVGYQQHDSSELLSFLLDGLHEDLNRVKDKVATETIESDGRPDDLVAKDAWQRHLLRNRSVIVDLIQGQFKSRVICPQCDRKSITFDPFMMLSVPLPRVSDKPVKITLVRDAAKAAEKKQSCAPRSVEVRIPKRGRCGDILDALAEKEGLNRDSLTILEEWRHCIHKIKSDSSPTDFGPSDLISVYEIPAYTRPDKASFTQIELTNAQEGGRLLGRKAFGHPSIVTVPKKKTQAMPVATLRKAVRHALTPFIKGGWKEDGEDEKLYSIHLMNSSATEYLSEVKYTDETASLSSKKGRGVCIGLVWTKEGRKRYLEEWDKGPRTRSKDKSIIDVKDCVREFTKEERLNKMNAWYCNVCNKHQLAMKKFDLWKLPDVLVIHLKRFSYTRQFRHKLDDFVDFPLENLDLSSFVTNPREKKSATYNLYAISNHFGGIAGGHYTAFAKNLHDGNWYKLDDQSVSKIGSTQQAAKTVRTSAAYVLFYSRATPAPKAQEQEKEEEKQEGKEGEKEEKEGEKQEGKEGEKQEEKEEEKQGKEGEKEEKEEEKKEEKEGEKEEKEGEKQEGKPAE